MRLLRKISPITFTLKLISILAITLRTKPYRNYTKKTLIILRYKHSRKLIGLHLRDLSDYSDVMEYGSLIRRASQYHKHCMTSLTRTTVRNGQMQKLSYTSTTKDPSIRTPSTTVLNHVHQLP